MINIFIRSDNGSWHCHSITNVNVAKHQRLVSNEDERGDSDEDISVNGDDSCENVSG